MMHENELTRLVEQEMQEYKSNLLQMPGEKIYEKSTETHVKEEFCSYLMNEYFTDEETEALCKVQYPVDYLYQSWLKNDYSMEDMLMATINDAIEKLAPPIAKIEYLANNGSVVEYHKYSDYNKLSHAVKHDIECGVPFELTVYRDREGYRLPLKYITSLGIVRGEIADTERTFDLNRYPYMVKDKKKSES